MLEWIVKKKKKKNSRSDLRGTLRGMGILALSKKCPASPHCRHDAAAHCCWWAQNRRTHSKRRWRHPRPRHRPPAILSSFALIVFVVVWLLLVIRRKGWHRWPIIGVSCVCSCYHGQTTNECYLWFVKIFGCYENKLHTILELLVGMFFGIVKLARAVMRACSPSLLTETRSWQ